MAEEQSAQNRKIYPHAKFKILLTVSLGKRCFSDDLGIVTQVKVNYPRQDPARLGKKNWRRHPPPRVGGGVAAAHVEGLCGVGSGGP